MRAVVVRRVGSVEDMHVEDVPDPDMRENDVMIQVEACGVCFHDVVTRNGTMRRGVKVPFIPGHEVSGTIIQVGPRVRNLKIVPWKSMQ